jgi:hypothetical protein
VAWLDCRPRFSVRAGFTGLFSTALTLWGMRTK